MTQQAAVILVALAKKKLKKKFVFHFKIMLSSNNDQEKAEKISQEMLKNVTTASTWFGDNKINCHAIVQPIFMRFSGIVGYGNPHNVI